MFMICRLKLVCRYHETHPVFLLHPARQPTKCTCSWCSFYGSANCLFIWLDPSEHIPSSPWPPHSVKSDMRSFIIITPRSVWHMFWTVSVNRKRIVFCQSTCKQEQREMSPSFSRKEFFKWHSASQQHIKQSNDQLNGISMILQSRVWVIQSGMFPEMKQSGMFPEMKPSKCMDKRWNVTSDDSLPAVKIIFSMALKIFTQWTLTFFCRHSCWWLIDPFWSFSSIFKAPFCVRIIQLLSMKHNE